MPLHGFDIVLPGPPEVGVELAVRDWSGSLAGIEQADASLVALPEPGPRRLAIGPGTSERRITVAWTGGACDSWLRLDLAADARTLTLHEPQGPGCDAVAIGRAVELRFEAAVDPTAFTGTQARDAIAVADINPTVVAFADALHGWVAGTTERGEAVIEETVDGGRSWSVSSLGAGTVTDLAVSGDAPYAGRACPETNPGCGGGMARQGPDDDWFAESDELPMAFDVAGNDGIAAFLVPGRTTDSGMPRPEVRIRRDGFTWAAVPDPCGWMNLDDVAIGRDAMPLALCSGEGGGGGQRKALYGATADERWEPISTTDGGGLPIGGTGMRFDIADDGRGWMWGVRTPLLATDDGGASWRAVAGPVDGDVVTSAGASVLAGGAGYQLMVDPERDATILSWTPDGLTWEERFAWPIHVLCCG